MWVAALTVWAAAVQAQTHAPPEPRLRPGEVVELDTAIARAAASVNPAAPAATGLVVSCGKNGGLLNVYACDMMAAELRLSGRSVEAATTDAAQERRRLLLSGSQSLT